MKQVLFLGSIAGCAAIGFFPALVFAISVAPLSASGGSLIVIGSVVNPGRDFLLYPAFPGCTNEDGSGDVYHCTSQGDVNNGDSITQVFGEPPNGTYTLVEDAEGCYVLSLSDCLLLSDNTSVVFSIGPVSAQQNESSGRGTSEGGVAEGGGPVVHFPEIVLRTNLTGQIIRGTVPIVYSASDEDDEDPLTVVDGLRQNPGPVDIGYQTGAWPVITQGILAKEQPATGTYIWDTTKMVGDTYRLKLRARDKDGNVAEAGTEDFTIDNTPPGFTVHADPAFTKGEPVRLEILSSEALKSTPSLTITQFKHDSVTVPVLQDPNGHPNFSFKATYQPIEGFDGPALISLSGADAAGNIGTTIIGDSNFAVGVKPPPSPVIDEPRGGEATSSRIAVSGFALNAQKIVARVNGRREYVLSGSKDGQFRFDGIELDPAFNKGKNVINVVSYDPLGNISAPVTLNIFLDSPPQLHLSYLGRRSKYKDVMTLRWTGSDINDDKIVYDVALSDDRGGTWRNLATGLNKTEFRWDTATVPDGSNYVLRVTASDGKLKTSAITNIFTTANGLPAIVLETAGDFYTSERSRTFGGVVRSKDDVLKSLEWSGNGGVSWQAIQSEDGAWDSAFEKFHFDVPFAKAGSYDVLIRGLTVTGRSVANAQKLKVIFDNNAPTVHPEELPRGIVNVPYLKLSGTASDDFSGIESVEYSIDGREWFRGSVEEGIETRMAKFKINHPDKLADGLHRISIRAVDQAGNISETKNQTISIDATPPRIGSFTLRANGALLFPSLPRTFEAPAASEIRVQVAIGAKPQKVALFAGESKLDISMNSSTSLWESHFAFSGEKTSVRLTAEDEAGNRVERELGEIIVPDIAGKISAPKLSLLEKMIQFFKLEPR